jgi:hypothetical protein
MTSTTYANEFDTLQNKNKSLVTTALKETQDPLNKKTLKSSDKIKAEID